MLIIKNPKTEILLPIDAAQIEQHLEQAGRICYKSEPEGDAGGFIRRLIKSGHESVIEHHSISVKIICDRGVSHELVRHRLCSFSQESTRYVKYNNNIECIKPPWLSNNVLRLWGTHLNINIAFNNGEINHEESIWLHGILAAAWCYQDLCDVNWKPERARSVLPNSLKTELTMTANLREWRHIFNLRCSKAAHPQMREIMKPLLFKFWEALPTVFSDIKKRYFLEE